MDFFLLRLQKYSICLFHMTEFFACFVYKMVDLSFTYEMGVLFISFIVYARNVSVRLIAVYTAVVLHRQIALRILAAYFLGYE